VTWERTVPSLHPYVSSIIEDNDASSFVGPSMHLLTSLRCLEAKMWTWRCEFFWKDLEKVGRTLFAC
jgi:hypothetical protein